MLRTVTLHCQLASTVKKKCIRISWKPTARHVQKHRKNAPSQLWAAATSKDKLQQHVEESLAEHFGILAKKVQSLEKRFESTKVCHSETEQKDFVSRKQDFVEANGGITSGQHYDSGIDSSLQSMPPQPTKEDTTCSLCAK